MPEIPEGLMRIADLGVARSRWASVPGVDLRDVAKLVACVIIRDRLAEAVLSVSE